MIVLFAQSPLSIADIIKRSGPLDALVLAPSCAQSMEELELAHQLAKRCFESENNIANRFKYEFLLWLTGKTDIKSAMAKSVPKEKSELLIVVFGEDRQHVLKTLDAKEKKKEPAKRSDPLRLEEISLSRIKN